MRHFARFKACNTEGNAINFSFEFIRSYYSYNGMIWFLIKLFWYECMHRNIGIILLIVCENEYFDAIYILNM